MLAESFQDALVDLGAGGPVVLHADPGFRGDIDGRVGEQAHADDRRDVLQHARVLAEHLLDQGERLVELGVVGDADRDVELTDFPVVVQDLADDLAIGITTRERSG